MDGGTPDISDAALQASPHGQLKEIAITMGMGRGRPRETKEDTIKWIRARRDQPVTAIVPSDRRDSPRFGQCLIDLIEHLVAIVVCTCMIIPLWGQARGWAWDAKDEPGRGLSWVWKMKHLIDIGTFVMWIVLLVIWFSWGRKYLPLDFVRRLPWKSDPRHHTPTDHEGSESDPSPGVSDENVEHSHEKTTLSILTATEDEYDQVRLYHQGSKHAAEVPEVPQFPGSYQDYREMPQSEILTRLARALRRLSHVQTELDGSRTTSEDLQSKHQGLQTCLQRERETAQSAAEDTQKITTGLSEEIRDLRTENRRYQKELIRLKGKVWTFARVRPKIDKDKDENFLDLTSPNPENQSLRLQGGQCDEKHPHDRVYNFDRVFHDTDTNQTVYEHLKPMVQAAMEGLDVAIILDGPSGSGKSYTMFQPPHGIAFSIAGHIFHRSSSEEDPSYDMEVRISSFKVYREQLLDATEKKGGTAKQQLYISDQGAVYRDTHYQTKVAGTMAFLTL